MNVQNIPAEMRAINRWCVRRGKIRADAPKEENRAAKVPLNARTFGKAMSNNPQTWSAFEVALHAVESGRADGLVFALAPPFIGVDLDHVIDENGRLSDDAARVVRLFDSYTEISPSGAGLHIIVRGNLPSKSPHKRGAYEIYGEGRFFTVTGDVFEGRTKIREHQQAIDDFLQTFMKAKEDAVLAAIRCKPKLKAIFDGDLTPYGGDDSRADLALLGALAKITNGNEVKMREYFMRSQLARSLEARKPGHVEDYLRRTIEKAKENLTPRTATGWPVVDTQGRPIRQAIENLEFFLTQNAVTVRQNEMSKALEIARDGEPSKVSVDATATVLRGEMAKAGLALSKVDLLDGLSAIAEENAYSPVCEWLSQCPQIDNGSFAEMMKRVFVFKDGEEDVDFAAEILKRWMIGAVRLAFNHHGDVAGQGVVVLVGPQGIGKSRFCEALVPCREWFGGGLALNPKDRDSVLGVLRYWIVELGEMPETAKADRVDSLKAFLTQPRDTIRKPYGRAAQIIPRRTAFIGSSNEAELLRDRTGNRRFWPIRVGGFNLDAMPPLEKLWGEVMLWASRGDPHFFRADEMAFIEARNHDFERPTALEIALMDGLAWDTPPTLWRTATASDLCSELGFPVSLNGRMGRALQHLSETRFSAIKCPQNHMRRVYTVPHRLKNDGLIR